MMRFLIIFVALNCFITKKKEIEMNDFKKIEFEEGIKILKSLDEYQIKDCIQGNNLGSYYKLKDSTVLFKPSFHFFSQAKELEFIIFKNIEISEQYMNKDFWFESNIVIWEKYRQDYLENKHKDSMYLKERFKEYKLKYDSFQELLILNSIKFKKFDKQHVDNYIFLYLFICEILKMKLNLEWGLVKDYGPYNAYYRPILLDKINNRFIEDRIFRMMRNMHSNKTTMGEFIEQELKLNEYLPTLYTELTYYKQIDNGIIEFDRSRAVKDAQHGSLGEAIWGK